MSEEIKDIKEELTEEENIDTQKSTYTIEEVQALLQKEGDRRVSAALKKAEQKKAEAIKEAEKLAKMNEEEKYKYELDQREKMIAEKEQQLALAENRNEAAKALESRGISIALTDLVVAEDADTMMANIKLLEDEFNKSVKDMLDKKLASNTPKKNLPPEDTITKEVFRNMGVTEQARIYEENPALYKQLTS